MPETPDQYWQAWPGPTGTTGPEFLGVTGAVTGPAFFGVTGATGPTGIAEQDSNLTYLFNRCRVELSGASDQMIRMALFDILHEFFNDTSLWLEAIPGQLTPSTAFYFLQPGNVQSLGDPFPEGVIIGFAGLCDLNYGAISADMPQPPILRVQYPPSNPQSVFATVIKSVQIPSTSSDLPAVPTWVVSTYVEYLIAGVKGRLEQQSNRPYSDAKNGMIHYQFFRQGVNIGRTRAIRRNSWGGQAWAFPQQFRTNTQRGWSVTIASSLTGYRQ